jgi:hypothetical protein
VASLATFHNRFWLAGHWPLRARASLMEWCILNAKTNVKCMFFSGRIVEIDHDVHLRLGLSPAVRRIIFFLFKIIIYIFVKIH